jgi:hypothetical protein
VPPTASANATAVRSELTTELGRIDVAVSTRLATSGYTAPDSAATIAGAVWDEVLSGHTTAGTTGKALDDASSGGGTDWTSTEREHIRNRLGIDGTASAPSATPTLATPASVRTELATELSRIDVTTSSRLATSGYTAPPTASDNATATLLAAETTPIRSDIRKVNAYTVKGSGTLLDPWGPV